jgi:hypothetical protein
MDRRKTVAQSANHAETETQPIFPLSTAAKHDSPIIEIQLAAPIISNRHEEIPADANLKSTQGAAQPSSGAVNFSARGNRLFRKVL